MRHHKRQKINKKILQWGLVCVCIVILVAMLALNHYKEEKESERLATIREQVEEQEALEAETMSIQVEKNVLKAGDDFINAYDVISDNAAGEILIDPEYFADNVGLISAGGGSDAKAYISDLDLQVSETDILILQFCAYTKESSVTMAITVDDQVTTISLSSAVTNYYIPITGVNDIDKIVFKVTSDYISTVIDSVYLVNYEDAYTVHELTTGAWTSDDRVVVELTEEDSVAGDSSQILVKDGYLFTIANGALIVYEIDEESNLTEVCSIDGMGQTRDMAFSEDGTFLVITARQNGAYFIDISDPKNVQMISHYDTLEATTGLDISGNYAFLASRYFGIEVVDISDPMNPEQVAVVNSEEDSEYQDCCVDGNYLYVGVYAQKRVDIYDISDLSNWTLIAQIDVDGAAQGMTVDNGLLYVATARNSQNEDSEIWEYGNGTGNGLEIYDVSDPTNLIWLSTVKTNGRMSYIGRDVWDVQVSGGYAYVSDMQNGLYIYNVEDASNPVCLENIIISTEVTEYDLDTYVFSWDTSISGRGAVYHVALEDGVIWIATRDAGIYRVESEYAMENDNEETVSELTVSDSSDIESLELVNFEYSMYDTGSCIWAVCADDDRIYLACGEDGIQILDSEMNLLTTVFCDYSVKDIKVSDGYLYAAESEGGIGIYEIEEDNLIRISSYNVDANSYCVSQLQLTGDGNYLIAQASTSKIVVLDISDPAQPVLMTDSENLTVSRNTYYFRNIVTGLINGETVGVAGSTGINWFTSVDGELTLEEEDNTYYYERGGYAAYGNLCIVPVKNGYRYFEMGDIDEAVLVTVEGLSGNSKITAADDILVLLSSAHGSVTILDISDIDNPVTLESFTVNGNPDIAVITENVILIPLRYGGLLKLER